MPCTFDNIQVVKNTVTIILFLENRVFEYYRNWTFDRILPGHRVSLAVTSNITNSHVSSPIMSRCSRKFPSLRARFNCFRGKPACVCFRRLRNPERAQTFRKFDLSSEIRRPKVVGRARVVWLFPRRIKSRLYPIRTVVRPPYPFRRRTCLSGDRISHPVCNMFLTIIKFCSTHSHSFSKYCARGP